jgi:hypothetical protein
MTNDEARMTNRTAMTNDEAERIERPAVCCLTVSFFIAFSPFLRHSDVVIRHSPGRGMLARDGG